MSLIVGIRAAEGLVLATDSLCRRDEAVFFTARKLFTFPAQPHVSVAVCGTLSFGRGNLLPVSGLLDAFTSDPATRARFAGFDRVPSVIFAAQLGEYLSTIWRSCTPPETDETLDLVVAGYDAGMPYGELYHLQIPKKVEPTLQRLTSQPFFAAYWGNPHGARSMVEPYVFPFDIMPLTDCAALAAHLITSTAQLEAWSSKRQAIGGPVQLVTITQATGVRWLAPAQAQS